MIGLKGLLADYVIVSFWYLVPIAVCWLASSVLLPLAVYYDASSRNIASKKMWGILTFFCGFIAAIIYIFFSNTNGEKDKAKKKKSIIFFVLFILVIITNICYSQLVFVPAQEKASNSFSGGTNLVYYLDDDGNEVIYDKMGKTYTYDEFANKGISYYTKEGVACSQDADGILRRNDDGRELGTFEYNEYFIDEDGYLCVYDSDKQCREWNIYIGDDDSGGAIYYTKDGKLLYPVYECQWDKDGNLIFDVTYKYKDFTYDQIPKEDMVWIDE